MGIFGRDDRSTPSSTPAQAPARQQAKPQAPAESVTTIARPTHIDGTLVGEADVQIHGELTGKVDCSGKVFVAESGKVKALLHARTVVVAGNVEGDVTADEKIELRPSAHLVGNITAPRILIEEGASFEGQVNMHSPDRKKTAPTSAARKGTSASGEGQDKG